MTMTRCIHQFLSALLCVFVAMFAISAPTTPVARADDETARAPEPFTVRDASVFLLSAYGTNLNDRGLFKATVPSYMLSRRPSAPRNDANTPAPLSLITFSGPPTDDVDILLEFDGGRFLSHWPPARMRSKRLLWAGLSMTVDAPEVPARMVEDHWLSPMRESERLFAHCRGRSDRGLFYDAELKYKPHVTLNRTEATFRVKNQGDFEVHDVHIYRPEGDGQWSVWSVDAVGVSKKVKKSKADDKTEEGEESPEEVFDKTDEESAEGEDEPSASESEPAEGDEEPADADESTDESASEDEAEEPKPATKKKGGLAAFIAKAKAGELPSVSKKDDFDDDTNTAEAKQVGTLTAEEALQTWTQRLHELGLGDVESEHITTILKAQALRADSTMLVYRMDDAQLEKLLPLEATPYPDRLYRVAIVIVQDADPDLQSEIEALVEQLGDDAWPQRVAAQEQLIELGLAAKPKLEEAVKSDDAEVVFRAEQLLEILQTTP